MLEASNKIPFDMDYTGGRSSAEISRNTRLEKHRETTRLGNERWQQIKTLREDKEKAGKAPLLTPDSTVPFTPTLLALYKDPILTLKRPTPDNPTPENPEMRKQALRVYESGKEAPKGKLWCPISRDYFSVPHMVAAPIVPTSLGASLTEYISGSGSSSRLNIADNCLLIHCSVEDAFVGGKFVLLPADSAKSPLKTWKIQITNVSAKNTDLGRRTLGVMDGEILAFKNDNRPAARFLYFLYVITLLRNKRDRQPGWEKFCIELPIGKPFAAMKSGPYLRHSMLLALAKSVGDVDAVEEAAARLLGEVGQETFEEEEQLDEGRQWRLPDALWWRVMHENIGTARSVMRTLTLARMKMKMRNTAGTMMKTE